MMRFFTLNDLWVFKGAKIAKNKKDYCVKQQPFRQKLKDFDNSEIALSQINLV